MSLYCKDIASPVGRLKLVAGQSGLVAVLWEREPPRRIELEAMNLAPHHPLLLAAEQQLKEYFSGTRTVFDLPLDPQGSDFQRKVWRALRAIPFGETRSYRDLAKAIGAANAVRAVGAANGKNPLAIIIPCHRVIGVNGALTGFAGGLDIKAKLLDFEAAATRANQ
ncbi:MAG TPA: methylated-DNA--[protein]-cysteine S-methyltransferase [Candidatus Binatia bacterium]|nr:methylated-DNA--[protein]-cysteine S-methyltransferase [Candidatus Binatia bacterium]